MEVALPIDGIEKDNYNIVLNAEISKYISFSKPLEVKAGSVINFVSKVDNATVVNSVVTLIIKLD